MNKILVRTSFAAVGGLLALGMGATAFAAVAAPVAVPVAIVAGGIGLLCSLFE